jgi:YLP motif-containing protein 1
MEIDDSPQKVEKQEEKLSIEKVKKFDRNLRIFDGLQEEFFALLTRRVMVDEKFITKNTSPPSKLPEFNWYNQEHIVDIRELLEEPSAQSRPQKIAIFIRGAPGSGKSFLARLIERKELESDAEDCVTVLTIDKFFDEVCYREVEPFKYEKFNKCTLDESKVNEHMEELSHELENLVNYGENEKSLVVIDGDFCELSFYHRMWNIAVNEGGYVGYTIELNQDDDICIKYNDHRWSEATVLKKNAQMREIQTPAEHTLLDPEYLYSEFKYDIDLNGDIFTIDVNPEEISDEESDDATTAKLTASKWDSSDFDKYERMDGTKNKTLHHATMNEYLQENDEWTMRPSTSGKKRVRWADIEEKKAQERERKIGFIVGQTDWNRIMNDTDGKNALEKTKYIEPRRKN